MSKNTIILPGVLKVGDVIDIPKELLKYLTRVTTKDVETHINAFCIYNAPHGDEFDKQAASILADIYTEFKQLREYMDSDDMKETVKLIVNTNITDIDYNTDINFLTDLEERLTNVLDGEDTLINLDDENFNRTITEMCDASMDYDPEIQVRVRELAKSMRNVKTIFVNKGKNTYQVNTLLRALKQKDKINLLLKTIEDVLTLGGGQDGNVDPREWRFL